MLPPVSLPELDMARIKDITERVASALDISGPFIMQIIRQPPSSDGEDAALKIIECNLRASRFFPFVSKDLGHNLIRNRRCRHRRRGRGRHA